MDPRTPVHHTHTYTHTHTHTHTQSESSGAVTDITNSTSVESGASVPVEEIPDLLLKIAKKEMKNSSPDSLLKFGTEGVRGRQGEGLGFSSTVDPPEETEVYRLLSEHTVSMVLHHCRSSVEFSSDLLYSSGTNNNCTVTFWRDRR